MKRKGVKFFLSQQRYFLFAALELSKARLWTPTLGWAPIPGCDPYEFVLTPLLWVPMGRLHVNFQRARPTRRISQSLQSFGLTVLEAEKWRSSNQAEIKILLCKSTLWIPKITIIAL